MTTQQKAGKPYGKSESAVHRMRCRIFDYDDTPKEAQAGRVLRYLIVRKVRQKKLDQASAPVGPYSGLTAGELRATGTCEADWF